MVHAIAALCARTHDRFGAAADLGDVTSPYLPTWPVHGQFTRVPANLSYAVPCRAARDAREIHWAFDLARRHVVPHATAEFELHDALPALLFDAPELFAGAEINGRMVDARPQGDSAARALQRFHLRESIDALEALIPLIPEQAFGFPDDAFPAKALGGEAVAASGLADDGLVWCDEYWSWFPKPFRALADPRT